ncbi:MAG: ABC transporter permease [Acidimicrobiales bacterium]
MTGVLARRLAQTLLVLVAVAGFSFLLLHLTPGDPVDAMLAGENVSAEEKEALRHQLGLDRPLAAQFVDYATDAARGDLGTSIRRREAVGGMVADALPATIELVVASLLVAVVVAVPAALISAARPHGPADRAASATALLGISMPSFWLGILLILLFAVRLRWLPPTGRISDDLALQRVTGFGVIDALLAGDLAALRSILAHLALPAITLGTAIAATLARVLRSSLLEVRDQEFMEALEARGTGVRSRSRHLLRNALPPVITVMGVRIGALLGGAIVVETVFSWPGAGRLIVEAIRARDYPVVQGAVLVMALLFVAVNLLTDVLHAWLDPRLRLGKKVAV